MSSSTSLHERIAALSAAQRARLEQELRARGRVLPVPPPADAPLPLTPGQRQLWVVQQLQPHSSAYHIAFAWRSDPPLQAGALQRAVQGLVERHEALRTVFETGAGGEPVQRTLPHAPPALQQLQAQGSDDAALQAQLQSLAAAPFDLSRAPLMRVALIGLPDGGQLLLWVLHHLVADGWSRGVLLRELGALYEAALEDRAAALPVPTSLAAVQRRQLAWLAGPQADAMAAWWREQLAGLAPLSLPADRPHSPAADWRSATLQRRLPALSARVAAAASACGATPFMLLLTVFKLLLSRWTGRRDLAVAIPVAGRHGPELAELIGFFVNTLVVRSQGPEGGRVVDWVDRVKRAVADAIDHAELPLARVIDAVGAAREPGRVPLVELMFQYQGEGYGAQNSEQLRLGDARLVQAPVLPSHTKFDLTWHVIERDGGLLLAVEYRSALFDAPRIERWLEHFERLLRAVLDDPLRPAGSLPLLSADEAATLAGWQQGPAPQAHGPWMGFAERFEQQAARTPEAVAVATPAGPALSYRALDAAAAALAAQLMVQGIGRESIVGVCLPREPMLLVAMLAVWKAGAAWLALDPVLPDERLRYMAQDSGARLLLAQAADAARFDAPGMPPLNLLPDSTDVIEGRAARSVPAHPQSLAYVLYTSGSTGRPKGTLLPQSGLMHYMDWCLQRYPLHAGRGAPVNSSIGFDATLTGLFAPLLVGRCVTLLPEADALAALADAMDGGYSLVKLTPAHMNALAPLLQARATIAAERLPRAFVIGGEALTEAHVAWWRARHPGIALLNEYGPTETVVGCSVHQVGDDDAGSLPIGRPIAGAAMYLLDEDFNAVPAGAVGEIFIGGAGMACGYLGRPALTAERFLPDPFAREPGACMYRTGDLGRWRADGSIAYLGRVDQQLQLRGYRIEAGEVEAALVRCEGVAEAVVGVAVVGQTLALVAWVRAEADTVSPAALRQALQAWLPGYMVPAHVLLLDKLPLTPNGKVDRAALPLPQPAAPAGQAGQAGAASGTDADPAFAALHTIWCEVLGRPAVGTDDNFFDLGGDSVAAMQIVARAHQAGYALSPADMFTHQTLAAQAAAARPRAAADTAAVAEGPALLAPAQWALLQRASRGELPQPAHWNQSLLLDVDPALQPAALAAALQTLPRRHAALRQRFDSAEGGWTVRHAATAEVPLELVELGDAPAAELLQAAQRQLDVAQGPLLRAVLLRAHGAAQLLLVAHHLVVDGHSWRLLLADLVQALAAPAAVPQPAPALAHWTAALAAQAPAFARELPYWQSALQPTARLPRRAGASDIATEAEAVEHLQRQAPGSADRLVAVARSLESRPDTLLLLALAQTLQQWLRGEALVIDVEHHGRGLDGLALDAPADPTAPVQQGADLARCVGWFTASWPLRLQLPAAAPQRQLQALQLALDQVPQHGLGFGVLRQHAGLGASPAEVSFNHLGALPLAGLGPLRGLAREPVPAQRDPAARRAYLLEVVTLQQDGELRWIWRHDGRIAAASVEALARRTATHLQTLCTLAVN